MLPATFIQLPPHAPSASTFSASSTTSPSAASMFFSTSPFLNKYIAIFHSSTNKSMNQFSLFLASSFKKFRKVMRRSHLREESTLELPLIFTVVRLSQLSSWSGILHSSFWCNGCLASWRKVTISENFGITKNGTWFQVTLSTYFYLSPYLGLSSCSPQESRTSTLKLMQLAIFFSTFCVFSSQFTTFLNFSNKGRPIWLIKETWESKNRRKMSLKWLIKEMFQDSRNKLNL